MTRRRLLSSGELADELGISRRSISRYAQEGSLSVEMITPGGKLRFDLETAREELKALARARREQN